MSALDLSTNDHNNINSRLECCGFAFGINYFGICVTLVKQAHERLSVSLGG
jgi:hypothetical protein